MITHPSRQYPLLCYRSRDLGVPGALQGEGGLGGAGSEQGEPRPETGVWVCDGALGESGECTGTERCHAERETH